MLPDLTDEFVAQSYKGVLHTSNQELAAASPKQVYDGVGNPSAMKLGRSGLGVEITGDVIADNFKILIAGVERSLIDYIYPIDSVYFSAGSENPSIKFPGTNWTRISQGRFIVGEGTGNDTIENKTFISGENNNGSYSHTLTIAEMPSHTHNINARSDQSSLDFDPFTVQSAIDTLTQDRTVIPTPAGGDQPHNNTPPSFGLYIWKRIS